MDFIIKNNKKLRTGITTGTCAAACAKAACVRLLRDESRKTVSVETNSGETLDIAIDEIHVLDDTVSCSVIKDAGDDPDVTDGITITAKVSKSECGIDIDGGEGIGRVTKPGLKIPVGHAAINPVPLKMIEREAKSVCERAGYHGGLRIIITAPDGAVIAKKTMNERLGIVGGISILGTTGIVEPMSEQAVIETIKTEMNMQVAAGKTSLLITPGNYGREFARTPFGLDIREAIKCSNFIGEILDHAAFLGVEKITLIGHAGKLIKLAGGVMNTHSSVADCRMEIIAAHCALCGATSDVVCKVMDCVTVEAAIALIAKQRFYDAVRESIGQKIAFHLNARVKGRFPIEVIVFTEEHGIFIHINTDNHDDTQ